MSKTYLRKEILLDAQEVQLLKFAMKCTGLDMTTTMRLMIRQSIIALIILQRQSGVPKLPADLEKAVQDL